MTIKIPILRVEGFLIASVQVDLDDRAVTELQKNLLQRVTQEEATGVVIDLTTVDLVDSFMARALSDIAGGVHLLGAKLAIVGIQPHVAITLVEMGLTISKATTALDLEKGLDLLRQRLME
jgi:rsbT antagonist protein RsbS